MLKGVHAISLLAVIIILKLGFKIIMVYFVCVSAISVKSKYGSCSGSCTGLINSNTNYKLIYIKYIL